MPRIKARHIEPQQNIGYHGAILGVPKCAMAAGSIVVVTGDSGARLSIDLASNASKRKSTGLLFILQHDATSGQPVACHTFITVPTVDCPEKEGAAVWLGRNGEWSFKKPKTNPVQIGEVLDSSSGKRILLAPQARY